MTLSKSEIYRKKLEREEEFEREKSTLMTNENIKLNKNANILKGDKLNQPRHLASDCPMFQECPADGKCRSFDLSSKDCKECILTKKNMLCFKRQEMHSPENIARVYAGNNRESIIVSEVNKY